MTPAGSRNDPYRNFNFRVEIDGITVAAFDEVSGLAAETTVIEYRTGSDPTDTVRKLPGLTKYNNITLKRGITESRELWEWFRGVTEGSVDRRSASIILLDESRRDVLRWDLTEAFPCRWALSTLSAKTNLVAIEEIELAVERIELARP